MIHTIDPLTEGTDRQKLLKKWLKVSILAGRVDEKAAQLHAIASLQSMLGAKNSSSFVDGMNGSNSRGPEVRDHH